MNKQGLQEVSALFRDLGAISGQVARYQPVSSEPVFIPNISVPLMKQIEHLVSGEENRPIIRTVHHLACTGGSLISKCLSVLPNTYLLSEVHPFSSQEIGQEVAKFSPSNISKLARYGGVPNCSDLAQEIFLSSIRSTYEYIRQVGGTLILRDHTHSDYCFDERYSGKGNVVSLLEDHFELLSIVTVRDPVDSYNSLLENGWVHHHPKNFDEYCHRYLLFLDAYKNVPVFRYEDIVLEPERRVEDICGVLDLNFCPDFQDLFSLSNVTGDSGRVGEAIAQRSRKLLEKNLIEEILSSERYDKLVKKLGYNKLECEL